MSDGGGVDWVDKLIWVQVSWTQEPLLFAMALALEFGDPVSLLVWSFLPPDPDTISWPLGSITLHLFPMNRS